MFKNVLVCPKMELGSNLSEVAPILPFSMNTIEKKESFNLLLFYSSLKIQTKVFLGHLKESVSLSDRTVDHKKKIEAYFWKFNENCGSKRSNQGLLHFFLSIFEQDTSPIYTHTRTCTLAQAHTTQPTCSHAKHTHFKQTDSNTHTTH